METYDSPEPPREPDCSVEEITSDERLWVLLAHLGTLVAGFIAPLVIWLVKREESSFIEDQGKESLNFQITVFLLAAIGALTLCVGVGYAILLLLVPFEIVFVIIAAVRSADGERYRYPLCLRLVT